MKTHIQQQIATQFNLLLKKKKVQHQKRIIMKKVLEEMKQNPLTIAFPLKKVNKNPVYDKDKIVSRKLIIPGRSGNDHYLECEEPIEELIEKTEMSFVDKTFNLVLKLNAPGFLVHPEHDTVVLPPGVYGFTQQLEFNPLLNKMQAVFD